MDEGEYERNESELGAATVRHALDLARVPLSPLVISGKISGVGAPL